MRCLSGRTARKAPKGTEAAATSSKEVPPPLPEVSPEPDPVPMPAPYHHEASGATEAKVLGPKRARTHKDTLPCQQDKVQNDKDQVRDVYLKFKFAMGKPPLFPRGSAADEDLARGLACHVVERARSFVTNGPYNNRIALPQAISRRAPHPRTEDARADYIWQDGLGLIDEDRPGDPARLYQVGDSTMDNMPGELVNPLALLAATTIKLHGGVCEKFSSLVLGILSSVAPPGTIAAKIAWTGDHHYVVLRVGSSQWWVADPWPHNAFVLPWSKNFFEHQDTSAWTQMEVVSPVEYPFGVVFDDGGLDHSYQCAVKALPYTKDDAEFASNWEQVHNLQDAALGQHAQRRLPLDHPWPQYEDGKTVVLAANAMQWG